MRGERREVWRSVFRSVSSQGRVLGVLEGNG